jgi:hypothetical protein
MAVQVYRAVTVPGVLALAIGAELHDASPPEPLVHVSVHLRGRHQVAALVAALIDVLDGFDNTDADLDDDEPATLQGLGDGLPGDPDDAEPSHGSEGWTWPADGHGQRQVLALRSGVAGGAE